MSNLDFKLGEISMPTFSDLRDVTRQIYRKFFRGEEISRNDKLNYHGTRFKHYCCKIAEDPSNEKLKRKRDSAYKAWNEVF